MSYTNPAVEVMAPVGSYEALSAALNAGCHSIYFGVEQLNMRARSSSNFTTDDLKEIAERCGAVGVKSYITINTILYDHDISIMKSIVDIANESGISAIIASDHAVMSYCLKKGMPVHISTQANISNIESVKFYSVFADVMVLSRELSLRQVSEIAREIQRQQIKGPSGNLIKIEVFAHGALCMAVSGKCYLSLHSHNASANRGACIQNCRKQYIVTSKEDGTELEIDNEYIMSAKDLCTIGFLDKLLAAGITILKIEGRGRSTDYVDTTVKCYIEAIECLHENNFTQNKIEAWLKRLSTVYNRGFWDGYYLGRKVGEWNNSYGSKATQKKIYIGKGIKYFKKIKVGEFLIESHSLNQGDKILITGPTTGVIRTTVDEIRKDDLSVLAVEKGDTFSIQIPEMIRASDKLYKIVDP